MRVWQSWIDDISSFGLIGGFLHDGGLYPHNYPPLAFVILDAVMRCADALGTSVFVALPSPRAALELADSVPPEIVVLPL